MHENIPKAQESIDLLSSSNHPPQWGVVPTQHHYPESSQVEICETSTLYPDSEALDAQQQADLLKAAEQELEPTRFELDQDK